MGTGFGRTPALSTPDGGSQRFREAFGDMTTRAQDSGIVRRDPLAPMVGNAPMRKKGGVGDILATLLAVAADATDPHQRGLATRNVASVWGKRGEDYEDKLAAYQARQRVANLPGMNEREMAAYLADPKAWGSHMSDAATSRYQAATLNPGDQRFLGEGNGVYQAPTRGQLYAQTLNLQPGTPEYETAIRDQELASQGPTAFANTKAMETLKAATRARLEAARHNNRAALEGQRQTGRVKLRQMPAPPRLGGPPARAPSVPEARDAKGNTIYYRGGKWVDAQGNAVQ